MLFLSSVVATEDKNSTIINNEQISIRQNDKLINYFQKIKPQAYNTTDNSTELYYPDYYGGSYLDENKNLIVLLKDKNTNTAKTVKSILKNNDLSIKYVNYSYSELNSAIETIVNIQKKHLNDSDYGNSIYGNVVDCTLDDINNKIIISINNLDEDKIIDFKNKILDLPYIVFENSTSYPSFNSNEDNIPLNNQKTNLKQPLNSAINIINLWHLNFY